MSKLKTKGVITQHEYKQAEEANKFSITDKLICSYCAQPVTLIINRYANHYVNCTQHPYLKLTMTTPPVDPQPPYKQMHFSLSRLERNRPFSNNEKSAYIALEKGCPFCDRYMAANLRHLVSEGCFYTTPTDPHHSQRQIEKVAYRLSNIRRLQKKNITAKVAYLNLPSESGS